jgi:hypothetical protein
MSYMTKDGILPTCSATSIADAMISITNHPSTAEDADDDACAGVVSRHAKHWIQRALNNITGSCEYSQALVASMLLGYKPFTSSKSYWFCYGNKAMSYLFSHASSESLLENVTGDLLYTSEEGDEDDAREADGMKDEEFDDLHALGEEEIHLDAMKNNPAKSSSEGVSFTVSKDADGKSTCKESAQHIDYACRGEDLKDLSLYLYTALISIHPKSTTDESEYGRNRATSFAFETDHPHSLTHEQRLKAKSSIPILSGKYFPKYPVKLGAGRRTRQIQWAKMVVAIFFPWGRHCKPAPTSVKAVVDRVRSMGQSTDMCERTMYGIIQDCSVGLQTDKRTQKIFAVYRSRSATRWSDEEKAEYQPSGYDKQEADAILRAQLLKDMIDNATKYSDLLGAAGLPSADTLKNDTCLSSAFGAEGASRGNGAPTSTSLRDYVLSPSSNTSPAATISGCKQCIQYFSF